MKVYPTQQQKQKAESEDKELSTTESVTKMIALIVAFITVGFFFFKILFF